MGESVLIGPTVSAESREAEQRPSGFWRPERSPGDAAPLHCDGIPLDRIAEDVGTPVYVYSAGAIRAQYRRFDRAFEGIAHRIHFSVKANANLGVLRLLRSLGAGVDIVSGGELHRARLAGFTGSDIVFSGVGKTREELAAALDAGVALINVESAEELELLGVAAAERRQRAPVAIRINPEVTVDTPHAYTRTGERGHKFGVPIDEAMAVCERAIALPSIALIGLDMHIGSQIYDTDPYVRALDRLVQFVEPLRQAGASLRLLDVGGGLAVPYGGEGGPDVEQFAEAVISRLAPTGLELVLEPGRLLVGNAGVLLTQVLYRKRSGGREYVITDAGMTELLRPSHYQAYHRVEAVHLRGEGSVVDIVGPVCETGDFLALDRELTQVVAGDVLAVHSAGAYGFVMASNYNMRRRPAEVLVDGDRYAVVRARESYDDLVRHENEDPVWRSV